MESIPEYDHQLPGSPGPGKPPWQAGRYEWLRNTGAALALVAGAGLLVWLVITLLTRGSEPKEIWKVMKAADSPDGKRRAAVVLHASRSSLYTGVTIQDGGKRIAPKLKNSYVFAMTFELPLRLRWDGPDQLTIFYPSDAINADQLLKLEEHQGVRVRYVGEEMFKEPGPASTPAP